MRNQLHKILITLTLIFITSSTIIHGQFYKYKSTSVSMRFKLDENKWSDWSEPEEAIILLTIDVNNDRITVYSKETQIYEILEYKDKTTDEDGDDVLSHYCLDKNGGKCFVKLFVLNSQNKRKQLYVFYNDMQWVYNINYID
jgi:hypothetical protein